MEQEFFVWLAFSVALLYIGRLLYRSFKPGTGGCAKGCGSCGAIDFKKLEKEMEKKRLMEGREA